MASLMASSSSTATLYASPILLANLGQSENVSLAPLAVNKRLGLKRPVTPRPTTARLPPIASEVTLRKLVTPLSSEKALNHALYANLKDHFEHKQHQY